MAKYKNIVLVAKSVLAKHLGVSRQVVGNWAARGLIKSEYSKDMGMTLVEKVNKKPTKTIAA